MSDPRRPRRSLTPLAPLAVAVLSLLLAAPAAAAGFRLQALEGSQVTIKLSSTLGTLVSKDTPVRGTMSGNDDDGFLVDALDMTADSFGLTVFTVPIEVYDITLTLPDGVPDLLGREDQLGTEIVFDQTRCDCDDFQATLGFVADIDGDIITPDDLGGGDFQGPISFSIQPAPQAFTSNALAPGETLQTNLEFSYPVNIPPFGPMTLTADVFLWLPEPGSAPLQGAALVALAALARRRGRSNPARG